MDERLKKFVQLVDAGSFVKAARDMHISQPALSVSIAKLERELHTPLLVHGIRPLTPTPAGRLAYAAGKEIIVKTANLKTMLAELAQRDVTVSVGMIDSVASALFTSPESVDELERNASVSLVVDNSRNLLGAVERGELDLVFVTGQRHYSANLELVHEATEPLVAVCHTALQAESGRGTRRAMPHRFISYDQASTSHGLIMQELQRQGMTLEPSFYSTSPEVMLRLVLLQKGAAVLPYLLAREQLRTGELALVGRPPLRIDRPIHAVRRRDTVLASPLAHMVSQIASLLGDIYAESSELIRAS